MVINKPKLRIIPQLYYSGGPTLLTFYNNGQSPHGPIRYRIRHLNIKTGSFVFSKKHIRQADGDL
jgi:hypothetical protein